MVAATAEDTAQLQEDLAEADAAAVTILSHRQLLLAPVTALIVTAVAAAVLLHLQQIYMV